MYDIDDLKKMTLTELREIAEKIKVDGYSRLKKEYLVSEIVKTLEVTKSLDNRSNLKIENPETDYIAEGILEVLGDGFGFLRSENYLPGDKDIYMSPVQVRRFNLNTGDKVKGIARFTTDNPNSKFPSLIFIHSINGDTPEVSIRRKAFDVLIPIYPNEKLRLETNRLEISVRIMDLFMPIGKGQRGIIVAQPKTGKTTILKQIANSIATNYPDAELLMLLIDERPEEVTDMQRSIKGEVIYSTFDEKTENHIKVAKMVLERAKRLVEHNKDVVILLDSLTRLTRASNLEVDPSGRTLSGGLDPASLYLPKRFFGAARNIESGGSLTILATALVDTGSRMDDMIFEEFKGTGNMEIHLDRRLAERRIYPAIDLFKSGTRNEELILTKEEMDAQYNIRKSIASMNNFEATDKIISIIAKTVSNKEFVKLYGKEEKSK